MYLKAVLVAVVDTVRIIVVLHEHEHEASGEDGTQVTVMGSLVPHPPGMSTL